MRTFHVDHEILVVNDRREEPITTFVHVETTCSNMNIKVHQVTCGTF